MFRTAKALPMFVARNVNKNLFASGSKFVKNNKFQQFHSSMFALNKIPTDLIKKLRADTDAPLGQCKKALEESNGDMEAAKEWLRKKGVQTAEKKSSRDALQGLVTVRVADDRSAGIIVEVNSETDFVTRNEKFQVLSAEISFSALEHFVNNKSDSADLKTISLRNGQKVAEAISDLVGQVGENLVLRRWRGLAANDIPGALVYSYVHNQYFPDAGAFATLVMLKPKNSESEVPQEVMDKLGSQIAMHITGLQPRYARKEQVPADVLAKEKEILKEKNLSTGKKAEHMEKIIEGQLKKFYAEVVLTEQAWALDGKTPVHKILEEAGVDVVDFVRFKCSEEIKQ